MSLSAENLSRPVSPRWQASELVERFRTNSPNFVLMEFAQKLWRERSEETLRVLDIGGGAARNAAPLAQLGMDVYCTDLSSPMLDAAREKLRAEKTKGAVHLVQAPMIDLPFEDAQFDLIIAHGIWNLAHSSAEFRRGVSEAARVAKAGAKLFLFTFSRHTIPDEAAPVEGEEFVFTQFNGEPHCFLREDEIIREMREAGFERDPAGPLTEYNCPSGPRLEVQRPPVIYEGAFVRVDEVGKDVN